MLLKVSKISASSLKSLKNKQWENKLLERTVETSSWEVFRENGRNTQLQGTQ